MRHALRHVSPSALQAARLASCFSSWNAHVFIYLHVSNMYLICKYTQYTSRSASRVTTGFADCLLGFVLFFMVCVCMCAFIHAYIYIYIQVAATFLLSNRHSYIHTYIHTHNHAGKHLRLSTRHIQVAATFLLPNIHSIHTYIHTYTQSHR
jgi:hypothetical protein